MTRAVQDNSLEPRRTRAGTRDAITSSMPKTKISMESIGSFGEDEARRIAGTLKINLDITARVDNVCTDNGPTVWWSVEVRASDLKTAQAYLKGWRTGRTFLRIEDQPGRACGYPEYAAFFPAVVS